MKDNDEFIVGRLFPAQNQCSGMSFFVDSLCVANAMPRSYFVTSGDGESDNPIEAVPYHMALQDAGIAVCNILRYSSILPKDAVEVEKPKLIHGAELKVIEAISTARSNDPAIAGISYGWLHDKEGNNHGGIVLEYPGDEVKKKQRYASEKQAEEWLLSGLEEIAKASYPDMSLQGIKTTIKSFRPKKEYGVALVAICFVDFLMPVKMVNFYG